MRECTGRPGEELPWKPGERSDGKVCINEVVPITRSAEAAVKVVLSRCKWPGPVVWGPISTNKLHGSMLGLHEPSQLIEEHREITHIKAELSC